MGTYISVSLFPSGAVTHSCRSAGLPALYRVSKLVMAAAHASYAIPTLVSLAGRRAGLRAHGRIWGCIGAKNEPSSLERDVRSEAAMVPPLRLASERFMRNQIEKDGAFCAS